MRVEYTNDALKALRKIHPQVQTRIVNKINAYAWDPASLQNNVRALKTRPACRLRVGDYRVIFSIGNGGDLTILTVLDVGHRKEVYDE